MTMSESSILDENKNKGESRLAINPCIDDVEDNHSNTGIEENEIITLNIGGIRFQTFAKTLQRYPSTKLAQLNQLDASYRHKQNEYFFDRNPNPFCSVLDYYRTGELHCPGDGICGSAFKLELDFWGLIDNNIEKCCWMDYSDNADMKDVLNVLDKRLKEDIAVPIVANNAGTWSKFCHKVWLVMEYPETSVPAKIYTVLTVTLLLASLMVLALGTCKAFSSPLTARDVAELYKLPVDQVNVSEDGSFSIYFDDDYNYNDDYYYQYYYYDDDANGTFPDRQGNPQPTNSTIKPETNLTLILNASNSTNSTKDDDYQYYYYDDANDTVSVNESNSTTPANKPDLAGKGGARRKRGASSIAKNPKLTNNSVSSDQNLNIQLNQLNKTRRKFKPTKSPPNKFDAGGLRKPLKELWLIEAAVYAFFTVELIVRLIVCPSKIIFLKNPFTICDFLSLVPFYIQVILQNIEKEEQYKISPIDIMVVLRVLRLGRLISLMRNIMGFRVMIYTLKSSCREMFLLLVVLFFAVFSFATMEYYTEQLTKGDIEVQIDSIPIGIWWALVTMTTVGYGDYSPKTGFGLFIGSLCALSGILVIAFTVPIVVNNFMMFYKHASSLRPKQPGEEYVISAKKTNGLSETDIVMSKNESPKHTQTPTRTFGSIRTVRKISVEEYTET
ncbi:unnamed protein product [Owenia fusiformis]|uniref:BTB domain-containing protein n=1 Tax=Owenia fusiformis TaxID=6347 RepID=A0A8S4N2G6_OWEFU|nr:unnamed protein product [Owenia fusiformis]